MVPRLDVADGWTLPRLERRRGSDNPSDNAARFRQTMPDVLGHRTWPGLLGTGPSTTPSDETSMHGIQKVRGSNCPCSWPASAMFRSAATSVNVAQARCRTASRCSAMSAPRGGRIRCHGPPGSSKFGYLRLSFDCAVVDCSPVSKAVTLGCVMTVPSRSLQAARAPRSRTRVAPASPCHPSGAGGPR